MLKVRVIAGVNRDLIHARRWYQRQNPGAARRLDDAFQHSLSEIARVGHALSENILGFRHVLLNRFPHAVYFRIHDGVAIVTTMQHTARDPKKLETILRHRRHHQP